jgi:hypothetical protein
LLFQRNNKKGSPMLRLLGACLLACPAIVSANVMTFDAAANFPPDGTHTYVENGITATGVLSQKDGGIYVSRTGPWGSSLDLTMSGALFTAESIDIKALGSNYCADVTMGCRSGSQDPIQYIWVSSYLSDALVSSFGLYRSNSFVFETLSLSLLGTMDMLRIEARHYLDLGLQGGCNLPCSSFTVDNARLNAQPAPEPETLGLLALGGLAAWLSRRKCSVTA